MKLDKDVVRAASRLEEIFPALLGVSLNGGKAGEPTVPCFIHKDGGRPNLRVNISTQQWYCDVCQVGGDVFELVQRVQQVDFPAALRWLGERSPAGGHERRIVKTYDYQDEHGALIYQVVRYEPKDFRQRRPDGKGGWIWKMSGVQPLVYRRPQLTGREAVAIVGGEKDADTLWAVNLPATTNSGGETKWTSEHTAQLVAAGVTRVLVIPDNDDKGRQHSQRVAQYCLAAGLTVKVLTLPDVPAKGDVSDYLATHTRDQLIALMKAAPAYDPLTPAAVTTVAEPTGPVIVCAADVEPEDISWVWPQRLARGKLSLLLGDPGVGKSTLLIDVIARISTGGEWPDGGLAPQGAAVLPPVPIIGETTCPRRLV